MLNCPTCGKSGRLQRQILDEPNLQGLQCAQCGGTWIRLDAYARWVQKANDTPADTAGSSELSELRDGPFLRRCPECQYIFGRYRVGHDLAFTIDRCYNCRGVWLDRNEWSALKSRNLHARLHHIFTEDWQQEVRRQAAQKAEEDRLRRTLGDADYARVLEVRQWIDDHPRRDLIRGMIVSVRPIHVSFIGAPRPGR